MTWTILRVNLLILISVNVWKLSSSFLIPPPVRNYNAKRCSCLHRANSSSIFAVRIWVEIAEEGFVDEDENLMTGEVCLRAVKAFASHGGDDDGVAVTERKDEEEKIFLGAGALVQRPPPSNICDAWMADCLLDVTNLQFEGAVKILDDLFHYHLTRSNARHCEEIISTFVVQSGMMESEYHCASYMAAISRGFKPLKDFQEESEEPCWRYLDREEEDIDALVFDFINNSNNLKGYFSTDQSCQTKKRIAHLLQRMNQTETSSIFE